MTNFFIMSSQKTSKKRFLEVEFSPLSPSYLRLGQIYETEKKFSSTPLA